MANTDTALKKAVISQGYTGNTKEKTDAHKSQSCQYTVFVTNPVQQISNRD